MKKAFGFLAVLAASAVMMCASAYAAVYSAGGTTSSPGETVTIPVKIAPAADETSTSVNGYAVELTYDSSVLTPVKSDSADVLGADCYATTDLGTGVLVADVVDVADTTKDKVVVAWADANKQDITAETVLANVTFTVNSEATVKSTDIEVKVLAAATDATTNDTTYTVANGTVTLGSDFLRGDANGDGVVDIMDATLIGQYTVSLATIQEENMLKADANADDSVDIMDATLVGQYTVGLATIPD